MLVRWLLCEAVLFLIFKKAEEMEKCKLKNNIQGEGTCKQTIKIKSILIVDEETGKLVERII